MIQISLELEEWQRVLAVLSQGQWAQVNALMMKIGEQLRAQSSGERRRGNGADAEAAEESRPA
jgi:hypothetical protein